MSFIETFKKIAGTSMAMANAMGAVFNPHKAPPLPELPIDENYKIVFSPNNQKIRVFNKDKEIFNTYAVSGKPGYTTSEYENLKDTGPIPRGTYYMTPSRYIKRNLRNITKFNGDIPGVAWGRGKFQLTPDPSTETFGRDGFNFHGGSKGSSSGCGDFANRDNCEYDKLVDDLHNKKIKLTPEIQKKLDEEGKKKEWDYTMNSIRETLFPASNKGANLLPINPIMFKQAPKQNLNSNWDKFFEVTKQFPRDKRVKVIVE